MVSVMAPSSFGSFGNGSGGYSFMSLEANTNFSQGVIPATFQVNHQSYYSGKLRSYQHASYQNASGKAGCVSSSSSNGSTVQSIGKNIVNYGSKNISNGKNIANRTASIGKNISNIGGGKNMTNYESKSGKNMGKCEDYVIKSRGKNISNMFSSQSTSTSTPCSASVIPNYDVSKGTGGPPVVRSSSSSNYSKPLFVDCSVEYELPNVPKIPKDSQPLLVIHPGWSRPSTSTFHIPTSNGSSGYYPDSCVQCRPGRKREHSENNNYSSTSMQQQQKSTFLPPASATSYVNQPVKRARKSSTTTTTSTGQINPEWLSYGYPSYPTMLMQHHHPQASNWINLKQFVPSWSSRHQQQQQHQLYIKQQQQQQQQREAYFRQQQAAAAAMLNGTGNTCPGCINGKCYYVWNKENLSAIRYRSV